ncbi:MAG: hypothetical protein H0X26_04570 [Alphaproteobacteria bacterium]|nr:hypothetical protein [Alphaproteobacteria bacterium]
MHRKITTLIQFVGALGFFIAGIILFNPTCTRAAMCDCWCLVGTGPGDSNCFSPGKQDANNCNSACQKEFTVDYSDGDYWCGITAEKDCRAVASPGHVVTSPKKPSSASKPSK